MAEGLNRVMLLGHLGQDPEMRSTQGGQSVLNLRMATTESYADRDGERKERTEWHSVTIWGKRAEALNRILAKGKQVLVEGRLQTRSWEDKQGQKRYTTEVVATNIVLLGGGGRGGREDYERDEPESHGSRRAASGGGRGSAGDDGDEIPFLINELERDIWR